MLRARRCLIAGCLLLFLMVSGGIYLAHELHTSRLQARYLTRMVDEVGYSTEPGPSPSIRFPATGPYDIRLGYALLPGIIDRLTARGYKVEAQARWSPRLLHLTDQGFFPIFREKTQAGLCILDRDDRVLFAASCPERAYKDFDSIPDLVVESLLFIENQNLLAPRLPYRNPAVEWDRLAKAGLHMGVHLVDRNHRVPGGSTLATQIEKYRHSPGGLTSSVQEKFRQMGSAALRAYLDGEETMEARRRIVLDYLNTMPLGAAAGNGELFGLGDGLWGWYGADFERINWLLANRPTDVGDLNLKAWALAYKQVLSLFLAQRRPLFYLVKHPEVLEAQTRSYLNLLARAGIISPVERDAALQARLEVWQNRPMRERAPFMERKAANAVRYRLSALLEIPQLYALDRLDLTVKSTLDRPTQQEVTRVLRQLRDPAYADSAGLRGFRLLERGDPSKLIYSFTLYECGPGANLLRVQVDNFDQPFNINEGTKLELGSSAKLRTLITYLEIIASLHERYAGLSQEERHALSVPESDPLSRWAIEYLADARDTTLTGMLEAAMQRRYSASPKEEFFTGGGLHTFSNFDSEDDGKVLSVREAFRNSVNLVFIRLMQDIVQYYILERPESIAEILEDPENPQRQAYLTQFVDREGRVFVSRFYDKYHGKSPEEALEILLHGVHLTPVRLAVIFRSVAPQAGVEELASFVKTHLLDSALSDNTLRKLYADYSPETYSLADRAYLAQVHPLELWTVAYLHHHPEAGLDELIRGSEYERQAISTWLFKTYYKQKQDKRIHMLLEIEAFQEIHRVWKRLGYPFEALVPSYATAIGSSADRPAALAELVGIILNHGMRYPSVREQELLFGSDTPYETFLRVETGPGERVLRPDIAAVARDELIGVVEEGTARRVQGAFLRSDGSKVSVGEKTGTGDNRYEIYTPAGRLISSRVMNRTATFVFTIGDRFFGAITAYVSGPDAAEYGFTSSLPVQILRLLAPELMPLIERADREAAQKGNTVNPLAKRIRIVV